MAENSKIEWTDNTWNPIRASNRETGKIGWHCEHATTGCEFCYAEGMNKRLGTGLPFKPGHRKDIEIFLDDKMLAAPLRWRKPRMIFVCSMTDAFASFVTDDMLDKMFHTMGACDDLGCRHTFQILTKRSARMRDYMASDRSYKAWNAPRLATEAWPPRNIWLGVSAERQQEWDERKEHLRNTPAAVRFASFEPLLGNIVEPRPMSDYIQWAIVGGESGKNARPMHPDWARSIRDQCSAAGVAYFFKQWGEWGECERINVSKTHALCGALGIAPCIERDWARALDFLRKSRGVTGTAVLARGGKAITGRLLDGREHNAMPATPPQG